MILLFALMGSALPVALASATMPLKLIELAHIGHGYVNGLAWSPDSQTLGVATSRGIWLYNATDFTREPILIEGYSSQVWFSPDRTQIASNTQNGEITFFDAKTRTVRATLPGGLAASISPDWAWMYAEEVAQTSDTPSWNVPLWNLSKRVPFKIVDSTEFSHAIRFTVDGRMAGYSRNGRWVKVWDTVSGKVLAEMEGGHDYEWPADIAFSPDGQMLVAGGGTPPGADVSYGKDYLLGWDSHTGKTLFAFTDHGARVSNVGFSPDGKVLATGSDDGTLRLRDPRTGEPHITLPGGKGLTFSGDSHWIATNDQATGTVRIYRLDSGDQVAALPDFGTPKYWGGTQPGPVEVTFSPDSKLLASINSRNNVTIRDATTGKAQAVLHHDTPIQSVIFSPDSQSIGILADRNASSDREDRSIYLWNIQRQELLAARKSDFPTIGFNRSHGVFAAVGYFGGTVAISDIQTNIIVKNMPFDTKNRIYGINLSYDGTLVAVLTQDETLTVFEIVNGAVKQQFKPACGLFSSENIHMDFSHNSRFLFYCGHLWNLATGVDVMASHPDTVPIYSSAVVHLSDDGRYLFGFQGGLTLFDSLTGTSTGFDLWNDSGAFSPQNGIIAYGNTLTMPWEPKGTAISQFTILDVATGHHLAEISGKDEMILGLAFSPDGTRLAVVGLDDSVRIYAISWEF